MKKSINYSKLSASMTPKERAILIIELIKKGVLDIYPDPDKPLTTEKEIREVVAACPSNQTKEYNFLISLKDYVWNRYLPLLEYTVLELEVLVARFFIYALVVSRDSEEDKSIVEIDILDAYSKKIRKQLIEIANYKGVIEKIQNTHFNGVELLPGNIESPLGSLPKIPKKVGDLVDEFNNSIRLLYIVASTDLRKIDEKMLDTKIDTYKDSNLIEIKMNDAEYASKRKN